MRKGLLALISYSITNVATTLLLKLAGSVSVSENGQERNFFHPFMQTEIMIIGEALCFIPFYFWQRKRKEPTSKLPAKITLSILPLSLDLTSSILIFIAFNYLSGSVYSILAGQVIVFTAIFSKFFLKNKISRAQIAGSVITTISAILAGVGESFGDQESEQLEMLIWGIGLVTIAMVLQAVQVVVYEQIYTKYDITALQMVGYQGIIGAIFWTILLMVLKEVGCPFSGSQCVFDSSGGTHLEDFTTFFSEVGENVYLLLLNLIFLLVVARFNYDQSTVIVTASAFTLCIIRIFSNSLIWIIGIIITVIGADRPQFNLQSLNLTVNGIKILAFILSTIGLLIYNEFICKNLFEKSDKKELELLTEDDSIIVTEQ